MAKKKDPKAEQENVPSELGNEGFEEPNRESGEQSQSDNEDEFEEDAEVEAFDDPVENADEEVEQSTVYSEGFEEADRNVLDLRHAVEDFLIEQVGAAAASGGVSAEDIESPGSNIQGVGIGDADDDFGLEPGAPALTVYCAESTSIDDIKRELVDTMGISAASGDDVPVNVVVTGIIEAYSHRFRIRPAPGGVSIGHCKVTAGTLGCLARGARGTSRYNRLLLLSNNHVIANSNNARYGDWIIQPGRYDGGTCNTTKDRIAILERFVRIDFKRRANYVDCATGWCWPRLVRRDHVYRTSRGLRFFRINSRIAGCRRGRWVGKTGRTTQLTRGYVTDCSATIRVNYGNGRVALFRDQMAVRAPRGNFSAGGDSGSVIWTWDRSRYPVGLLFAGGGGYTFANKMTRVVRALGITLVT